MKLRTTLMNFIPLLAIPVTLAIPKVGAVFFPYTSWILGLLLFSSFLALEWEDLVAVFHSPKRPFYAALVILVVAPLLAYPIMSRFFPEYLLGAVIFMLLPAAVASPAVAGIYGGNIAVATVNAVSTNLLSPFTIPLFLQVFMGQNVKIAILPMFLKLLLMVSIPFAASILLNKFFPTFIGKTKKHYRLISLSLLFFLFFAAVSPYVAELKANLFNFHLMLVVFVAYFVLYFLSRLVLLSTRDGAERIAITANIILPNVGMGVVIVQQYFGSTEMLFMIAAQIIFAILVGFFKYFR